MEIRQIVYPGEKIDLEGQKPRNGLYEENDEYYSEYFGVVQKSDKFIDIVPFNGPYMPRINDKVIGKVIDVSATMWTVDINSPYFSLMHMNDTPWHVTSGDLRKYLNVGDYIYAKVSILNEIKESWLSLKDVNLRKLEEGSIIYIKAPKVPRVIGKAGNMINMIKSETNTKIIVGQNGLIWIDGEPENVDLAINAIGMVEKEAHTFGLTDRVKAYLDKMKGGNNGRSEVNQ
ncbi:exosome complex RNA-binding protein Rrp4 [Picrophilus oshimae]|uniref:Exosome complex component Rrp4 n=1 Tax=Picrophilus torridus (strain ATCC 700027 / DSM 9790 / JCM 10055 / NBRC 100828 / KAW 2/3) TaxID=1122961 RepID=RRP4_PICTO|nr:RecName: Full=Exosome complex component Rrp4 [Picrophilus oshimae DSM 9789]AAT42980.1 3'->5' exoribonuclease [Picrophilus oshimae DSM 9789]